MSLRYVVQMADAHGFDFGGVNMGRGVAAFDCKGDAIAFAIEIRRRAGVAARVLDRCIRDRSMKCLFTAAVPDDTPF